MSIFTAQAPRARRMSGLAAYAQVLPQVRARGYEALLELDWVCDYEEILRRVYSDFSQRPEYRGHPWDLANDSATVAHWIWLERCPQATVVYEDRGWWGGGWWGGPGGHGHHHHHHHHHQGGGGAPPPPPAAPPGGGAAPMMIAPVQHRQAMPMGPQRHIQAVHQPHSAMPRGGGQHGGGHGGGGGGGHRGGGHRGLGATGSGSSDGVTISPSMLSAMRNGQGMTEAAQRAARGGSIDRIQEHIAASSGLMVGDSSSGSLGPDGTMPSLSIEGALPTGIAAVLGAALGLVVVVALVK